ncbi:MFS transporter [Telluria mixta]|uniref:MFS transporter n=1 Tax=Telluria mixta TaxID=34071 RepID=A0ABT2C7D1_9BURK|nr:MFS transporter [Telluria mixta]MCS0633255.1 MFS transporter [Telluria mixta]WEM94737.1 MFS transporter [Telluria mixta]
MTAAFTRSPAWSTRYLLFIAGMGGLLYGIDVGIIAGALPYLESTAALAWKLNAQQLSFVVAAVLLGSVLSSLFAGLLADVIGRRPAMVVAGALFVASIPLIALADGYVPLLCGRLLQGVSGGLIGVIVPLYLAECLPADRRGRGAALFQLLLTVGLVAAALIGLVQARSVQIATDAAAAVPEAARAAAVLAAKDHAWRGIFWMCLTPGIVFTLGCLLLAESPRWLAQRGQREAIPTRTARATDPLLSRRYVLPFLLACLILACNQATGINSVLAYVVNILNRAGLSGASANLADVLLKVLNALMTIVAVLLVDRKGRRFLLMVGTAGIVVALLAVGLLFRANETQQRDVSAKVTAQARGDGLSLRLDAPTLRALGADPAGPPQVLTVAYAYGPFTNVASIRSDDPALPRLDARRADTVQPDSVIGAAFRRLHANPFPDPAAAATAPLAIETARLGPLPTAGHGWLVAVAICLFVASFAVGPGVCVWLALSELMPTRIRSNGMSIALLINQFVSTSIAAVFLPTVGRHGYSTIFFFGAACTVVYFLASAFLLPETRGKTLEEIDAFFARPAAK